MLAATAMVIVPDATVVLVTYCEAVVEHPAAETFAGMLPFDARYSATDVLHAAAVAAALKTTTARPLHQQLRAAMPHAVARADRARRADAAVTPPRAATANRSPWTKISARPSLPKPPTWTMCRFRD